MRASGAEPAFSRTQGHAQAAGQPSARARAAVLEYAAGRLLPAGSSREALGPVLEHLVSAYAAEGALVIAPGAARPVGADGAGEILDDLVLLAQVRTVWAARGGASSSSGEPFETELDSGQRRTGLLVVPAEPADREPACALALVGQTSRWKAGARATLRALATIIGTLPAPSAAGADNSKADNSNKAITARSGARARAGAPAGAGAGARAGGAVAEEDAGPAATSALAAALVAGAPSAIVAVDADRRIREFNPAAEALFGRRRAGTIGLDMPETLVPERYRPQFVDAMAGYLATGDRSGFSRRVRLRALRADGGERPVELTPMPVTVGEHTYFFGFLRDASELEEATRAVTEGDARFRLLSEIAPVGIVQTDPGGVVTFVNDRWSEMSGIPAGEIIGQNWRATIHPSDVARLDSVRDTSGVLTELAADARLVTAFGEENWVHVEVRRITDADGQVTGRVAALTDVNDRMLMEAAGERDRQRLTEQNTELRDLNEAKVRYLATVSHELRTPLTSIVSFAELIRSEDELSQDAGEYLDIIQRNAERLLRVVGDLVDLEGLEEGVARLDLAPISVPAVARESVRSGWAIAAVDGISLDVEVQDGPDVQADSGRIQQVLDNLISNAVKFSAAGGHVEVRATHDASEWRIDVADAGMGIPASEVGHLFDRFFRASNARETRVPGSGLGLPTAKAIAELHGGRIEVASVPGTGTTFSVYLPIAS